MRVQGARGLQPNREDWRAKSLLQIWRKDWRPVYPDICPFAANKLGKLWV